MNCGLLDSDAEDDALCFSVRCTNAARYSGAKYESIGDGSMGDISNIRSGERGRSLGERLGDMSERSLVGI